MAEVWPTLEDGLDAAGDLVRIEALQREQDSFNGGFDVAQALQGGLDEVAFYDRALNDEEIRTLFVATTCGERCDGVDNDSDGRTDEGFIGSGPECAAESCAALLASGLAFGSGGYYLAQAPGVLDPVRILRAHSGPRCWGSVTP